MAKSVLVLNSPKPLSSITYKANTSGSGFSAGDIIILNLAQDQSLSTPTLNASWYNATTRLAIATPLASALDQANGVGSVSDSIATSSTGSFSLIAFAKKAYSNWDLFLGRFPGTLGTKSSENSLAVVIASDQLPYAVKNRNLCTVTQRVVPVTASSTELIPANTERTYLSWMVVGPRDVTIVPNSAATIGVGKVYMGVGVNQQGGSEDFPNAVPENAFYGIALATGSSLIVWEGVAS